MDVCIDARAGASPFKKTKCVWEKQITKFCESNISNLDQK
jgi:hypothetical protein